jgi:hypothetical protein
MSGDSIEPRATHAIFTFGRFQPPTIGHKVLIDSLEQAAQDMGGDAYVFASSRCNDMPKYLKSRKYKAMVETNVFESCDANENPLSVYQKITWLQKMYPDSPVRFINTTEQDCRTIFAIADKLRTAGYTSMTMMVGSDRVPTFEKMFEMSENITVTAAGKKRNSSNKPSGMSGTKMRQAAVKGDFDAFKSGVLIGDMTEADAKQLMNEIREGLGYKAIAEGGSRSKRKGTRRSLVGKKRTRSKTRKNTGVRILETRNKVYRIGPDGC